MRAALVGLLVAAACANSSSERSATFTVTDSAGVELIQNGEVGSLGPGLLALTEKLRIGAADGPEVLQFYRIGPIRVDTAGSIYVADNGSGELRVFSRDGAFERKIGRRGRGPGEFQVFTNVLVYPDLVLVVDGALRRATSFAPDGSVRDTWPLQLSSRNVAPLGRGEAGWLVTVGTIPAAWPYEVGVARQDTTRIAAVKSFVAASDGAADLREVVRYPRGRIYGIASPRVMTANSPVWEPRPGHAVDGQGRIYVSLSSHYQIDVFNSAGGLLRRVRRLHDPVPVSDELFERYASTVRTYYDTVSSRHSEWEIERASQLGRTALPRVSHLPVLGRLLVSSRGDLWVERPDRVTDPVLLEWTRQGRPESIWDVFAASGRYVGTVQLPDRFQPRVVTGPEVTGVLRDDLDVEHVARYRIAAWSH